MFDLGLSARTDIDIQVLEATDRALRTRTEATLDGQVLSDNQQTKPYLIPAQARRRYGRPQ